MVLISDKADTPALLKSLSNVYDGKVAFGFVRSNKEALVSKLLPEGGSAPKMPALVTICNGDLSMRTLFSGQLKSDPLTKWADGMHAGLHACKLHLLLGLPALCFAVGPASLVLTMAETRPLACVDVHGYEYVRVMVGLSLMALVHALRAPCVCSQVHHGFQQRQEVHQPGEAERRHGLVALHRAAAQGHHQGEGN